MKHYLLCIFALVGLMSSLNAIEEPEYELLVSSDAFEIRRYPGYLHAFVEVDADFGEAGSEGFRPLFDYISGENSKAESISMTAPVTQQAVGEKIAMTAPVTQQEQDGRVRVAFVMPDKWTLETLPKPTNPLVKIEEVPERIMAVVKYSGSWSMGRYERYLQELQDWIVAEELQPVSDPIWARYNSPFSLWFFRRNEIMIELGQAPAL